jgi:Protein of unknown function (DUF2586)
MLPSVGITKLDGQTGVVRPSATGVLAILAASSAGPLLTPITYVKPDLVAADFVSGPLPELATYHMPNSGKPIVAVRVTPGTPGAYGTVTNAGNGTAVPVAKAATTPSDSFDILITFVTGGALGTTGITYTYSFNGGPPSAVQALGTALEIAIPNTGAAFTLGTAPQTILANQTLACSTTRPKLTTADLTGANGAFEALRVTSSPFEAVLVDGDADAAMVTAADTWVKTMNLAGKYPIVILTARPMTAVETEAAYKTALQGIFSASTSLDVVVCADEADLTSAIRGITQPRPVGLFVATRAMSVDRGVEPAYVALGPLPGARLADARGNPKNHDEAKYPGLDDLRLTTLRSFEGLAGAFITNTRMLSPVGSDYVFLPHARVMNRAAEIAYQVLTQQLSVAVAKNPKPGPNGERYIDETVAQRIEGLVNVAIQRELAGQVSDIRFSMLRTDDISSNQGAVISCKLESVALAYAKQFNVTASYVKQITSAAAGT